MNIIEKAIRIATQAHVGQVDKNGEPYIFHPLRVMEQARNAGLSSSAVAAAVLHDVVEDTNITIQDLWNLGMSDRTLEIVEALTKPEGTNYNQYVEGLIASEDEEIVAIKFFDMVDNFTRISQLTDEQTKTRLYAKYETNLTKLEAALGQDFILKAAL